MMDLLCRMVYGAEYHMRAGLVAVAMKTGWPLDMVGSKPMGEYWADGFDIMYVGGATPVVVAVGMGAGMKVMVGEP